MCFVIMKLIRLYLWPFSLKFSVFPVKKYILTVFFSYKANILQLQDDIE